MKHRWYPERLFARTSVRRAVAPLAVLSIAATSLAVAPVASAATPSLVTDPASHVNTIAGTGSGGAVVGSINNFPGAAMPFGMVQFSPDNPGTGQGYYYDNSTLRGFGMNHASQGCGAFGDFPVLPTTVSVASPAHPWEKTNSYTHAGEVGEPGYYKLISTDDNGVSITSELTATTRTGVATFTFPAGTTDPKVTLRSGASNTSPTASGLTINPTTGIVTGYTTTGKFCGQSNTYTVYFAASFEQSFTAPGGGYGAWNEYNAAIFPGNGTSDAAVAGSSSNTRAGGYVQFPSGTTTVRMRIALSYVSTDNAILNMQTEVPTVDAAAFGSVRQAAHDTWNDYLGKVQIAESNQADTTTFYTLLYRSLLHPNTFDDVNGQYIGFETTPQVHTLAATNAANGQHQEHQYATFSDWDTYRSLAPLHAMLYPKEASDMAQSLVNDGEQSGSFPMWPMANASTGQMSGDNSSALISQLYAYGARDFDAETALQIMVDNSTGSKTGLFTGGTNPTYIAREGGLIYNQRKYAPQLPPFQTDHAVTGASITLEWSIDDFAISQFARSIDATGNAAIVDQYQDRSNYWQNLFNPTTKFISPRDDSGKFPDGDGNVTPSDFGYRGHITGYGQVGFDEGMAEQYLWLVPQDVATLTKVLGGREKTADRLDKFMTNGYNVGANQPYMWAGNEPNFQTPWLYNYLGQPWRTQEVVDDIRTSLFGPNPHGGEPGNDDLGAQASWYVWAALGIYPTTPGTDILTVNTPMTDKAVLTMGNGKTLTITADGASSGKRYIRGMSVDGKAVNATYLPDSTLDQNSTVDFTVGKTPSTSWGTSLDAAPPSFGEGSNDFVANASPSKGSLDAGSSKDLTVDVQQIAGSSSTYTIAVDPAYPLPSGVTVGGTGTFDFKKDGSGAATLPLTVASDASTGYYDVHLKVTSGATSVSTLQTFTIARANSLLAAQTVIGTSPESAPSGNFDGAGNTYSRDKLAAAGLAPGQTKALSNGTTVTWPTSPVGSPETVVPNGQTIVLDKPASTISFVGAGINSGETNTATVKLDDGTVLTGAADFSFGDWVKPSNTGSIANGTLAPVYGNTVVTWTSVRNANSTDPGAYIFATTPYTAPTGKKIVSVTLPTTNKSRIFTIAQDAASLAASTGSTASVPAAGTTGSGSSATSSSAGAPSVASAATTSPAPVTLRSLSVAAGRATASGRTSVVVKASTTLTNGKKAKGKVKVYVGKKLVKTVKVSSLKKGKVKVTLPKRYAAGKRLKVKATFVPSNSTTTKAKTSKTVTVKVKKK